MCWIKEAEQQGQLILQFTDDLGISHTEPDCENHAGTSWDDIIWNCTLPSE